MNRGPRRGLECAFDFRFQLGSGLGFGLRLWFGLQCCFGMVFLGWDSDGSSHYELAVKLGLGFGFMFGFRFSLELEWALDPVWACGLVLCGGGVALGGLQGGLLPDQARTLSNTLTKTNTK